MERLIVVLFRLFGSDSNHSHSITERHMPNSPPGPDREPTASRIRDKHNSATLSSASVSGNHNNHPAPIPPNHRNNLGVRDNRMHCGANNSHHQCTRTYRYLIFSRSIRLRQTTMTLHYTYYYGDMWFASTGTDTIRSVAGNQKPLVACAHA